eukprot:scaffold26903_cov129-Isochrysis_galbana.AAC.1
MFVCCLVFAARYLSDTLTRVQKLVLEDVAPRPSSTANGGQVRVPRLELQPDRRPSCRRSCRLSTSHMPYSNAIKTTMRSLMDEMYLYTNKAGPGSGIPAYSPSGITSSSRRFAAYSSSPRV